MIVLLDENLPHSLRLALAGHDVRTVAYMGWAGVKNGELLALAEAAQFQVFVTADQNLKYQQNFTGRWIAMIYLTAQTWPMISPHVALIAKAINAEPDSFQIVDCGEFRRR
ncbi:hypothetical protein SAMN05421770_103222 [Granulicella rosea]|uniref:DUF5615 domain-containing protein n=1 Tax=Granulicella rosea TaxID=474952 RepID=A0A239IRM2_9BACT|nr:DUF5615 family PIN-like protein [Granulicella rosea]SNS95723.1 hypothetical protein SAMN05421770_103222 [Granulicella rosea]